jgi:hypothetical protein
MNKHSGTCLLLNHGAIGSCGSELSIFVQKCEYTVSHWVSFNRQHKPKVGVYRFPFSEDPIHPEYLPTPAFFLLRGTGSKELFSCSEAEL